MPLAARARMHALCDARALMSGYSDEALGARGILDPGTNLLPKPFTSSDLDRCLAEVLGEPATLSAARLDTSASVVAHSR